MSRQGCKRVHCPLNTSCSVLQDDYNQYTAHPQDQQMEYHIKDIASQCSAQQTPRHYAIY